MRTGYLPRVEMTKVIEVYGRKQGFTREAFLSYQTGEHMKAAGSVPEFSERIRGATRNTIYLDEDALALPKTHPANTAGKDSVVELWFDNPDSAMAAFREPKYLDVVRPDEAAFSEVDEGWSLLCRERIRIEEAGFEGREKVFLFLRRRDVSTFKEEWEEYWPIFLDAVWGGGAGRIAENIGILGAGLDNAGTFDFALELWFDGIEMAIATAGSEGMQSILSSQASGLFDQSAGSILYLARERD